ncbi:MAG: alpha/beta hydrolase [Lachnospiraceae bacterium]|nr:alpha/beta hydrolase [Lachnospiraceae bacterium]
MKVHEFVEGKKPIMVLLHGVLTPWQIWMPQINSWKENYNIYAIALSAHTEECASEFLSLADEADKITQILLQRNIETIDVLCGISFGGKLAHEIWKEQKIKVRNLILDGAPLTSFPKIVTKVMIGNYLKIIHKSRIRDSKTLEAFKKQFLPEKYLEDYLKIADFMSDASMVNIVKAAGTGNLGTGVKSDTRILFLHGTKGNEVVSKKSAHLMQKHYPDTKIVCFKGDVHCQKAIYEPAKWIKIVEDFLEHS